MSYATIATMAQDFWLSQRSIACAAQEGKTRPYPTWVAENIWDIVSSPGWAEAWEYAVLSGTPNPGLDSGVITDGMILAAIQPLEPATVVPDQELPDEEVPEEPPVEDVPSE